MKSFFRWPLAAILFGGSLGFAESREAKCAQALQKLPARFGEYVHATAGSQKLMQVGTLRDGRSAHLMFTAAAGNAMVRLIVLPLGTPANRAATYPSESTVLELVRLPYKEFEPTIRILDQATLAQRTSVALPGSLVLLEYPYNVVQWVSTDLRLQTYHPSREPTEDTTDESEMRVPAPQPRRRQIARKLFESERSNEEFDRLIRLSEELHD